MSATRTPTDPRALSRAELEATADVLEAVASNRELLATLPEAERKRFLRAVSKVHNPDARALRRLAKSMARAEKIARLQRDDQVLNETGIRALRRRPVVTTPNVFPPETFDPQDVHAEEGAREAVEPTHCYVCKQKYSVIHHFYDQLCPPCAELNFRKRTELADLRGRVALLTGGRVKIGYQAGLKLLRAGAALIVTTRFPRNAASRYAAEPDFGEWGQRLEVFGLDLRHTPSVEAFCRELLATRPRLDFIVNNACQTVRRPPDFYAHMMEEETAALADMPAHARRLVGAYEGLRGYHLLPEGKRETVQALERGLSEVSGLAESARLSQVPLLPEELTAQKDLFPEGRLDQDLQQVDLRGRNSWRLLLAEVPTVELLEVQLVNAVAPFIFNARLKPLMLKTPERDKHIVDRKSVV